MHLLSLFSGKPEDKILSVKYKKLIDEQLVNKLTYFIQFSCKKSSKIIVEVNGTINSLVAGVIFKKALGEKAIALIIDFDTPKTLELLNICKLLDLNAYLLKRGSAYRKELAQYRLHQKDIRNFYIRFTNYHLSIQADMMKVELADIADKSDRLTNQRPNLFYGSIMPFYSLYKTEIIDMAKFLNLPTESPDEAWKKIDPVLFLLTEKQSSPEEIAREFNIDLHWLKKLKCRIEKHSLESAVNQFII